MTQRETLYKAPAVKHYDDGYMECPECGGEKKAFYLINLHYDGSQIWTMIVCPFCYGDGQVPVESEDKDGDPT
jgi:hypothetical protein